MFYQHFDKVHFLGEGIVTDDSFPIHAHRAFEFITVLEGNLTVTADGKEYCLDKGKSVLIFPEQTHSLKSHRSRHRIVIFSPEIVSAYFSEHAREYPKSNLFTLPDTLFNQLSALKKTSSLVEMKAALYSLCAEFEKNAEFEPKERYKNGLIGAIFAFVEKNYSLDCSLEALSKALGHNASYLCRYFGETTSTPYLTFVNGYRIEKACYLLTNTDKSVLECALECGYKSLRSFNRNFKIHTGISPSGYRKARRSNSP